MKRRTCIKTTGIIRVASVNLIISFIAVDQYYSHAGGNLNWVFTQNKNVCPVHGSEFTAMGNSIPNTGTAAKDLKKFAISIQGNSL
ncbi:MAG: hypothetical protein EAZ13_05355 [Sphingobacteriia bacterium]|nr:MAG: hypothetical protein EAZ35_06150 [Sphingobacteriia bacterium]TAH07668.1 MAG: hypothetical protein EAZ13_05355 [Sphingobacteriia bacterium]